MLLAKTALTLAGDLPPTFGSETMKTVEISMNLPVAQEGIRRLAVLRADVDDLGQAFVGGLPVRNMGKGM